jgi:hypothetical protein
MADTSVQDNRLALLNAQLTELQADKQTLENVANPNAAVQNTINQLTGKIQRTQAQISSAQTLKQNVINQHNAKTTRQQDTVHCHGVQICAIVDKYN